MNLKNVQPANYVGHIIEQQGPNGLFSVLEERGDCTDIEATYETFAGIGFFVIEIYLTNSGLKNRYIILNLLLQVVRLIHAFYNKFEKIVICLNLRFKFTFLMHYIQ